LSQLLVDLAETPPEPGAEQSTDPAFEGAGAGGALAEEYAGQIFVGPGDAPQEAADGADTGLPAGTGGAAPIEPVAASRSGNGQGGATGNGEMAGASASLPQDGLDLKAHLYAIEQQLILEALSRSGGTVSQAARLLGLRRTTLGEKMRRFGMSVGDAGD
jgi:hypothetical protein